MKKIKVKYLKSFLERSKGLIGENKAFPILFKTRFGIHTFGMKYPIDVVILDNLKIVKTKANLQPNRTFFWNPIHNTVIELPVGSLAEKGFKIGETITPEWE